jgi:hypothetical protein
MYLVQILLPKYGKDRTPLLHTTFDAIREELVGKFGGLTAYTQSPAEGIWNPDANTRHLDEIIMIEVMVAELDPTWWANYRKTLESRLQQESVVIRSIAMQIL